MKGMRVLFGGLVTAVSAMATAQGMLIVTDSGLDRVMALDPTTGAVVSQNIISDPLRFLTPKEAIDSGVGTVFVSDQISDGVYEYSYAGSYLRQVAGVAVGIPLNNVRGIASNGTYLFIANGGSANGAPGRAIVRVRISDSTKVVWPTAPVDPFDVELRANDILVTDIDSDDLVHYDYTGVFLGVMHNSDGVTGVDFPQQIAQRPNGNILLAGFTPPVGVYEFSPTGTVVNSYSIGTGNRGVYVLPNGKILYTYSNKIDIFDPSNNSNVNVWTGTDSSMQYVNFAYGTDVPVSAYIVVEGEEFAGDLNSLRSADENVLQVFSDPANLSANVQFEGRTSVAVPAEYSIHVRSSVDRLGISETLYVYNFATDLWVAVFGRTSTVTTSAFSATLTSNLGAYRDGNGDVRARLAWSPINDEDPAVDGWLHKVDQFFWSIKP